MTNKDLPVWQKREPRSKLEKFIVTTCTEFPECRESNTKLYLTMFKLWVKIKGHGLPSWLEEFITKYTPEGVVRCKRELIISSRSQKEKEKRYSKKYANTITTNNTADGNQ